MKNNEHEWIKETAQGVSIPELKRTAWLFIKCAASFVHFYDIEPDLQAVKNKNGITQHCPNVLTVVKPPLN